MIGLHQLNDLIAGGESLTVEFKSDRRQIPDKEIYEEVVSLANTSGGALLIGVEDGGDVTGAAPRHGQTTDPLRLQAAIFANTVPSINTRVSALAHEGREVLAIEVDRYPEPCATAGGKSLRRLIGPDGKPQSVPLLEDPQKVRKDARLIWSVRATSTTCRCRGAGPRPALAFFHTFSAISNLPGRCPSSRRRPTASRPMSLVCCSDPLPQRRASAPHAQ